MRFDFQVAIVGGAADDADPRVSPAAVPEANIAQVPSYMLGTDQSPKTPVLALEGTATQTATIQPWVLEDSAIPDGHRMDADPLGDKSSRKYYKYGTALTVTVGSAQTLVGTAGSATTIPLPCPNGRVYLQVTAKPAANAVLKAGWIGA